MKQSRGPLLSGLSLEPGGPAPLFRQLYEGLRQSILQGELAAGSRLPSTRVLAQELGLSRNTVKGAFEQLLDEGYIESRIGSGSRVAHLGPALPPEAALASASRVAAAGPSRRGQQILGCGRLPEPARHQPFAVGIPAVDEFPLRLWQRLEGKVRSLAASEDLVHGPAQGLERLRQEIAGYLQGARGVRCTADEVLILSSSQQALDLASRILLDPGDEAWIEEPGYLGARGALTAAGATLVPVPVDEEGLVVAEGQARAPAARLAYVTPSHQYPLGSVLSLARRRALLRWARKAGAWILEDDYDSEFRYRGQPVPALYGLDGGSRVIYIGTFTKVLFPALRLAYLVCARELMPAFVAARTLQDGHSPRWSQAVTAQFLAEGHFPAHLRRMRNLYRRRGEELGQLLESRLGPWLEVPASVAGMHRVAYLRPEAAARLKDASIRRPAAAVGLTVSPLSSYYLEPAGSRQGLVLGYTAFSESRLQAAVAKLEEILRQLFSESEGSTVSG